jgi:hypothetical protein
LIVDGFRRRGVEVEVDAKARRGLELVTLASTPWDSDLVAIRRYRDRLREVQPDAVLGFYDYDTSLCAAAHIEGIPFVSCVQIHWPACPIGTLYIDGSGVCSGPSFGKCVRHFAQGVPPSRLPGALASIPPPLGSIVYAKFSSRASILRHAARLVVPSQQMNSELSTFGYDRVVTVPSGIALDDIPTDSWPDGPKQVLYPSGSATERKGLLDFLEMAARLAPELPGTLFAAPNFSGDRVVPAMAYLSRPDLLRLIGRSYLTVLPIRWDEPFGLVALEAMACGRPVVAYDSGALPEIVVDGETGLLVPRGDRRALAEAVRSLLRDEERAKRMGAAGRRRVEEHFTVDLMTDAYLRIVQQVLAEHGGPVGRAG